MSKPQTKPAVVVSQLVPPSPAPAPPPKVEEPKKEEPKMPPMLCGFCAHFRTDATGSYCHYDPPTYSVSSGLSRAPVGNGAKSSCSHWETPEMFKARKLFEWNEAQRFLQQPSP